ncbi:hypothetical protein J22TS1_05160 [Siminovitchia terrae]|uniref:nuclease domain-containing protein n=1 Tax=Siminovitchia terrae TaxID=1914933 RepID=UPI001B24EFC2|nr:nuclease domain-containing protein [Siminovitchia terrae]GIN89465.1 hypothetical protein J22TS1_05160 [Siminovitchia terrae]
MDIPFKLTFYLNDSSGDEFARFSTSLDEVLENVEDYCYSCNELQDLRVRFESKQSGAELWIEIMDMLPEKSFKEYEIEQDHFLPSEDIRGIYLNINSKYNENKLDYSFLLPGIYRIVVTINKSDKYYSFLKVNPLRINEEQLKIMREEVENILNGLAKEVTTKRSIKTSINEFNNNDLLQKYHLLISQSEMLVNNIKLILKEPRYKIVKRYIVKSVDRPTRNDLKTTQLRQSKYNRNNKIPSYIYEIDYNLSVNCNLKKMLEEILKSSLLIDKYINVNIKLLKKEVSVQTKFKSPIDDIERRIKILTQHSSKLKQLKATLTFALENKWIKNIDVHLKNQDKLPRVPFYRTIYSLYLQLNKGNKFEVNPFEYYIYYWKETSKLYEIWGFLKLLLMLKDNKDLDLSETSGWIFDSTDNSRYPLLAPNTKITLNNSEGLKLVLWYDSIISKDDETTTTDNPLITVANSNRPDFRLDIYYQGLFKGSILADFKYRPLGKLGNPVIYSHNRYSDQGHKVYSQLVDYTYTKTFYLNKNEKSLYADFSTLRVFGIFPRKDNEPTSFITDNMTNIIRCSLSPGVEFNKIEDEFLQIINEAIKESVTSI